MGYVATRQQPQEKCGTDASAQAARSGESGNGLQQRLSRASICSKAEQLTGSDIPAKGHFPVSAPPSR